jgi:xylulokinase
MTKQRLGACYGNAFLAALGVGDVGGGDIRRWNSVTERVAPNAANTQR